MRSRAVRLIVGALALVAFVAVGAFLNHSEKQLADHAAVVRAFDVHAREAADALAELRAAQQAYVAAGQGVAFWMPKVAATADAVAKAVDGMRRTAISAETRAPLDEAAATLSEFGNVDKRARDYIKSGQQLMAADVVFTEGGTAAVAAAREIERARVAEHQALDAAVAWVRRLQAMAVAAAAGAGLLAIALLIPVGRLRAPAEETPAEVAGGDVARHEVRGPSPALKSAAQLCTDFSRVYDVEGLNALLGPAAQVMDAVGLVVWLGSPAGDDLRPVLAHGYSTQTLARMPTVPRSADNAAAAAYRTGVLQIVLARPGLSNGAIVAPLISPDGCIGSLAAEIAGGGEASDDVQALAAIFASQLAAVLSVAVAPQGGQTRTASG